MSRCLFSIGLATVLLSCATAPVAPSQEAPAGWAEMLDAYRLFAKGDYPAVRMAVDAIRLAQPAPMLEPSLDLLEAYALELQGGTGVAKDLYSSIVDQNPRTTQAYEASLRLRELKRLESEQITRAQLKQRIEARSDSALHRYGFGVQPLSRVDPRYPQIPLAAGIEGWVLVDFEISGDGTIADPVVFDSHPPFVFDAATLAAIRHWVYEPSTGSEPLRRKVKLQFELEK
jgi:TonB family protein